MSFKLTLTELGRSNPLAVELVNGPLAKYDPNDALFDGTDGDGMCVNSGNEDDCLSIGRDVGMDWAYEDVARILERLGLVEPIPKPVEDED